MERKRLSHVCILLCCLLSHPALSGVWSRPTIPPIVYGDVNGDGVVDVADISTVIDLMSGSDAALSRSETMTRADANNDGSVDVADIAAIIDIMANANRAPVWQESYTMYVCSTGDTVLVNWYEVEEQLLDQLKATGITKDELESGYRLLAYDGSGSATSRPIIELTTLLGNESFDAQVYVPILHEDENTDLTDPANWTLPKTALSKGDVESAFLDADRYGQIVFTSHDWMNREVPMIGITFSAKQMLQQMVMRNKSGHYTDSKGNPVTTLAEADFHPYVDAKVAAKLIPTDANNPELIVAFKLRVCPSQATMSRIALADGGSWYGDEMQFANANIDPYGEGEYAHDVTRLIFNLQQSLNGQKWIASTNTSQRAFDFAFDGLTGQSQSERKGIEQAKLGQLHGDLYFTTSSCMGDIEEGTPYWHDKNGTADIQDDHFFADRYVIKACRSNDPYDTDLWTNEGEGNATMGKYLFAYKCKDGFGNLQNYDIANGQMIAWIDNQDSRQSDAGISSAADKDANGNDNESVNIHFNWSSTYMRDLINRAGRYAADYAGTQDGYSQPTDNPFGARLHLNAYEGEETIMGGSKRGVPVMLTNADFTVRPLRPINVEFVTPWQQASFMAVEDAVAGSGTFTIQYSQRFRNQTGWPNSRVFPMDWQNNTDVASKAKWIGYYQGYNDGKDNKWNTTAWNASQEADRADQAQNYFKPVLTPENLKTWNADNVVPDVGHILINIGGSEGFFADRASQLGLKMTHKYNTNGNIVSTTFEYLNEGITRGAFDIIIPVTVKYAWGDITTTGKWETTNNIQRTNKNYYHNYNMNYIKVHFGQTIGN